MNNEKIHSYKTILVFGYSAFSKDGDHIITTVNEAGKVNAALARQLLL